MAAMSFGLRPISMALAIVLARLLAPADFGLLAMAMLVFNAANYFTDMGMRPTVVQTKEDINKVAHYAFVIVLTTSLIFTVVSNLMAQPLANFLGGSEQLVSVIRWMSLYVTLDALWIIPEALLRRDLRFKELSLSQIPGELASTVIAIPLALSGLGVWSLVIGTLSGQVIRIALLWFYYRPWIWLRPQKWDRRIVRGMFGFGLPSMGSGLMKFFQNQIDTFIVGRQLGTTAVGLYSKAFALTTRLADMLTTSIFGNVLFPSYAKMQDDKPRLARAYLKSTKMVFLMIVPVSVGLAITAPLLVPVLLGPRWVPMIPIWQIFSLYGLTRPISTNSAPVFSAMGQPRRNMTASFVLIAVMVPLLFLLIGPYGVTGAAAAVSLANVVAMSFNIFQVNQLLPGTAGKSLIQSVPFLVAGGLMALGVVLIQPAIITLAGGENVLALILIIIVAALIYTAAILLLQRALVVEIYELLIKALGIDRRWPKLVPARLRASK
jgi:PST family polysaccharide transporter